MDAYRLEEVNSTFDLDRGSPTTMSASRWAVPHEGPALQLLAPGDTICLERRGEHEEEGRKGRWSTV